MTTATPSPSPATTATLPPVNFERSKAVTLTRRLIYLYLVLLIFEGALRKWVVPQLANPLLIVRDPVVIAIYFCAMRARAFRWNGYVISAGIIGLLAWLAGIVVLLDFFPIKTVLYVTAFGFRCNFLHLPLIFVIPAVFDLEDVKRIGWWTILGMIPMALLMAWQFHASPDAFVNRTAGLSEGPSTQIQTSGGKIRPPGTFSFISGAIFYVSAVAAFLLHALMSKLPYKSWLVYAAGGALIVSVGVSGSRGAVLSVALVVASLGIVLFVRPDLVTTLGRNLLIAAILLWAVSYLPLFREGVGVLSERFTESAEVEERSVVGGLADRVFSGFSEAVTRTPYAPFGGWGLGVGTNGGSAFLMGHSSFLLTENEWIRIIFENGPVIGWAFLLWRVALTFYIGLHALRALKLGNALPLFIFSAGVFALLNAPLGQPTSAGFAVVFGGLCLAATRTRDVDPTPDQSKGLAPPARQPGRSVFAARLHAPANDHSNGSVDR
jgi:hypothetical protein